MKILPIDFDLPDYELSTWHDKWSTDKFGEGVLDPCRYYQSSKDGRYLYGVVEDEALNEEKAIRDHVLELLLRIRAINRKLKGVGIIKQLTYQEREELKKRRKALYNEFEGLNSRQTTDAQSLNPEPQQEQPKPTRGRGRPKETLKDKMIDDANGEKLQKIHTKMSGKKGKDAALIILACIKKGWMAKPTYTQVRDEFGDIGSKTGYNKYLKESMFSKEEFEGAMASLD